MVEKLEYFGCVFILDDIPHLYMYENGSLDGGTPLLTTDIIYNTLRANEIMLVGAYITLDEDFFFKDVDEDIETIYNFKPLELYTIKSGLEIVDLMDFNLFDMLISKLLYNYI